MCSVRSSFHGQLKEVRGVYVDNFSGNALFSRAFFLSHCHTDHMEGLQDHDLHRVLADNPHVKIYTSEHSATILKHNMSYAEGVCKAIEAVNLGTIDITLPETDKFPEEYITVTVIPAGHCLGSVMFLFRTSQDKTILYTGDFRIRENDVDKYAQLHSNGDPISIDVCYIDTTFLNNRFNYFPKRTECIDELVSHINDWLSLDVSRRVALKFSAGFGYEYVVLELYKRLNLKIYYKADKWSLYSKMDFMRSAVTNYESETKIHDCTFHYETSNHSRCGVTSPQSQFLFVRFSAMRWDNYTPADMPVKKVSETRIDVCFPTHCSASEIRAFLDYYRPKKVEGFPNPYVENRAVSDKKFNVLNSSSKRSPRVTPAKRQKMSDEKVSMNAVKKLFF